MGRMLAVVTGTTSGIGLETARGLAAAGWDLVLACRDGQKAGAVRAALAAEVPGIIVESVRLDLASLDSIRSFAMELSARHGRIDLLVNNAGVFCDRPARTVEGFERTIGVNFLGTFLLTRLLLPLLRIDGPMGAVRPRVVHVGSAAAAYGRLRAREGVFTRGPHGFPGYAASKLALVLFTIDLAGELGDRGPTVNVVHPGDSATGIWRGESLLMRLTAPVMKRLLRSPAEAARSVLDAATAPEWEGVSGEFLGVRGGVGGRARYADASLRKELMRLAAEAVGLA